MDELVEEIRKDIPSYERIRGILNSNPELVQKPIDDDGLYIIHYLCKVRRNDFPVELAKEIISMYPSAVQQKTAFGYALHQACRCNVPRTDSNDGINNKTNDDESIIPLLLNVHPEAAQDKDNEGWYPLHLAIMHEQSKLVIDELIKLNPSALQETVYYAPLRRNLYPLHLTCVVRNRLDGVIQLLLNADPKIARQKDESNNYPLHLACQYFNSDSSIFRDLYKACPRAILQSNGNGRYPLHEALHAKQKESTIQFLIEAYPRAVHIKANGAYPLHIACRANLSFTIIQSLVNKYPRGVQKQCDRANRYPLHIACRSNRQSDVVAMLLQQYDEAARHHDCQENYPLHYAYKGKQSERVIQILTNLYPEAVYHKNKSGWSPLIVVKKKRRTIYSWLNNGNWGSYY